MRRALLVVGKAPVPGRTKTRLVPPLSHRQAAALSEAFLRDTLDMAAELEWERIALVHPAGDGTALQALVRGDVKLFEQAGSGLGNALRDAFAWHLDAGFDRVVLIGSDNPTLPAAIVHEACRALDGCDLTVGPTLDGGYYLIGMREAHLRVFERIDWSTARVFAQTLTRAAELNLRVHESPEWFDVHEALDLVRLQGSLSQAPAQVAERTRAALARLTAAAPAA